MSIPDFVLEVRQDYAGAWRVYLQGGTEALEEKRVVLGGTWEMACSDAERIAREPGFQFNRPPQLWTPSADIS